MKYLIEKTKSVSAIMLALFFVIAVSLSSCGTVTNDSDDSDETEATEQAEGKDEHPAGEHPSGEHPSNDAEADSTATEGEHPEGEHPEDLGRGVDQNRHEC